ncbi:hypothetical protein BGX26_004641 [Mortierella sp. AD094]|nr:hypothetical protein BGX26_004641 [Mortierella sp. AD094]
MVVALGDKVQINDIVKYLRDPKVVIWCQDLGHEMAIEFIFIPFKSGDGFVAIEFGRINDFQKLCHEIPADPDSWENILPSYVFTVTREFKYGQNNEQTSRFLVFMNSSYKPFQHQFTSVADNSDAMTSLGFSTKKYGSQANVGGILSFAKSLVGDDLHSF